MERKSFKQRWWVIYHRTDINMLKIGILWAVNTQSEAKVKEWKNTIIPTTEPVITTHLLENLRFQLKTKRTLYLLEWRDAISPNVQGQRSTVPPASAPSLFTDAQTGSRNAQWDSGSPGNEAGFTPTPLSAVSTIRMKRKKYLLSLGDYFCDILSAISVSHLSYHHYYLPPPPEKNMKEHVDVLYRNLYTLWK